MYTADDKKQCAQLIAMMRIATFKEVTAGQTLSMAIAMQWLGDLQKKIDVSLSSAIEAEKNPKVTQIKKDKK